MQSPPLDRAPLLIIRELPLWVAPGSRVIDLGTGSGRHAIALARRGHEVDAIDESPDAIARLQSVAVAEGLPLHARVGHACSADIDFSRYGIVICTFMLHFLAVRQAAELLDRARAEAAPGTVHAIVAFTRRGEIGGNASHRQYYPEPGEIAAEYRMSQWRVHRAYEEQRRTIERRANGVPKQNLTSFVLAAR
jgi:cyclopropane fatty-acyl-phospholipid synthase-like methyltransferase